MRAAARSEALGERWGFKHRLELPLTTSSSPLRRILRTLCAPLLISKDIDFKSLAKATPGYVGADLASLTSAAGVVAVKRMFRELSSIEGQVRLGVEGLDVSAAAGGASIDGEEDADGMAVDGETDGAATDMPTTPGGGATGPEGTPTTSAAPSAATSTPASPSALSTALMTPAVRPSSSGLFATLPELLLKTPIASFLLSHQKALPDALLSNLALLPPDFASALKTTQPSSQREGFATIPSVTWSDIGALETIRDELHMAIVQPIRRPELFRRVGIEAPGGVLLWGPPGCGKTLLAKAVANESRANFISVKGPEVLNKVPFLLLL
jgi:ribosome biogenesis ATPase